LRGWDYFRRGGIFACASSVAFCSVGFSLRRGTNTAQAADAWLVRDLVMQVCFSVGARHAVHGD
jgi:hypothetical protein